MIFVNILSSITPLYTEPTVYLRTRYRLCCTICTMQSKSLSLPFILVSTLLTLSLGVWVLVTALSMTIGKPQQTEAIINRSGLYQAIIPSQVADTQAANPSLQNL